MTSRRRGEGDAWLGRTRRWETVLLKRLTSSMKAGSAIPADDIRDSGRYPVYGANGVRGYVDDFTHDGSHLVVGRQGALCGNVHLVSGRFWASEHGIVVKAADGVEPRWLAYLMTEMNLGQYSRNAAQPGIGVEQIGGLTVQRPPIGEQAQIADFLDVETAQLDHLVAKQEMLVGLLRERTAAFTVRSVFGLIGSGEELRDMRLLGAHRAVEQLLGQTPEHWSIRRFWAVTDRFEERNADRSWPMMSLKSNGDVVPRVSGRQEPGDESLPRYLRVRPDELVLNPMWLVGGAIGVSTVSGAVSPEYRVFRSKGEHLPRYLHHLLRTKPYLDQYRLYTRAQTTFDRRVQQAELNNLPLPVPPIDEQQGIAAHLDDYTAKNDTLIEKAERFIGLAMERRATLISAAVTGQIDARKVA